MPKKSSNQLSEYDIPKEAREPIAERALARHGLNREYTMMNESPHIADFYRRQDKLLADSRDFFRKPPELPERPSFNLKPDAQGGDILKTGCKKFRCVIVGESHNSVASKQLLIDNMKDLSKSRLRGGGGVKTLYMEHLMSDLHGDLLAEYARTKTMPVELKKHLDQLDQGHRTDDHGKYTFRALVESAVNAGVRVVPLDTAASYYLAGELKDERITVGNYIAAQRILQDRSGPAVALVGSGHANAREGKPGIAELTGGLGVRVSDVPEKAAFRACKDPGEQLRESAISSHTKEIKCDVLIEMPTHHGERTARSQAPSDHPAPLPPPRSERAQGRSAQHDPPRTGQFVITAAAGHWSMQHRSRDGTVKITPIRENQEGRLYIERTGGPWNFDQSRTFDSPFDLARAVQRQTGLIHRGQLPTFDRSTPQGEAQTTSPPERDNADHRPAPEAPRIQPRNDYGVAARVAPESDHSSQRRAGDRMDVNAIEPKSRSLEEDERSH